MNDAYQAEVVALRAENEELRERLRQMEEAFCGPLPLLWHIGLTKGEGRMLAILYRQRPATNAALHIAVSGVDPGTTKKTVEVAMCYLRKKVKAYDIEIETIVGTGYFLTDESRAIIRALVKDEPRQLDDNGRLFELRRAG